MSEPKNQKAICPLCGRGVVIGEDTEETECPNCTYQFRTNWGRIKDALKVNKLTEQRDDLLAACERIKQRLDNGGLIRKDTTGLYNRLKATIAAAKE